MRVDLDAKIPNNVGLSDDRKLQRALEAWQPNFIDWWMDMGPEGFQMDQIYLRTAVSVDAKGYFRRQDARLPLGIFLTPKRTGSSTSGTTWARGLGQGPR